MPRRSSLSPLDQVSLLLLLKYFHRCGRYYLSEVSGLGEGRIRYFLSELRKRGLVRSSRGGTELSEEGLKLLTEFLRRLGVVSEYLYREMRFLGATGFLYVLHCTCYDDVLTWNCMEERDVGIRYGARAVLILRRSGEEWVVPGVGSAAVVLESEVRTCILREVGSETRLIVVTQAGNPYYAIRSGLAIILHLREKSGSSGTYMDTKALSPLLVV